MFTGIVEELGQVVSLRRGEASAELRLRGPLVAQDLSHGESLAVDGVCLTVTRREEADVWVDVMAATLQRTGIGDLRPGAAVNLERALRSDGRFGGHVVQGHVDTTTEVLDRRPGDRWEVVTLRLPTEVARYVVPQGSIALDGVSLTVASLDDDGPGGGCFTVSLIPTTLEVTTLGRRAPGERVNVEVDVLAKYVERMLDRSGRDSG